MKFHPTAGISESIRLRTFKNIEFLSLRSATQLVVNVHGLQFIKPK